MIKQYLEVLPTFIMIAALACGVYAFGSQLKAPQRPGASQTQGAGTVAPSSSPAR